MDEDVFEKPSVHNLCRQSSLKTRLSPVYSSEEDSSSSEDDKKCRPKIVDFTVKTNDEIHQVKKEGEIKKELEEILGIKVNKPDASMYKMKNKGYIKRELEGKLRANIVIKPEMKNDGDIKRELEENSGTKVNKLDASINQMKKKEEMKNEPEEKLGTKMKEPRIQTENYERSEQKFDDGEKYNELHNVTDSIFMEIDHRVTEDERESSVGLLKALKSKKEEEINREEETCAGRAGRTLQNKNKSLKEDQMATLRPKSPGPRPIPVKGEKDESIWDKLGTLGRKKRIKEVQEVQAEGKYAIDSPGCPTAPVIPPEEYNLDDNEERCMLDPRAYDDQRFLELLNVLMEWVNDELASQRIIVQDLSEDLYDGQVLQKLLEKLTGDKLDVPEVTQSEEGQKQKLTVVLNHFNQVLGVQRISPNKWSVEAIHSKNIVAITHLLVALARHFRPPVRLPEHVSVYVVIVQKANGQLVHKTVRESLTKAYEDVGMRCERDAFDTLIDHAPEKLLVVKKSLVTFVNKHLNKMNFEVTEIESQFHDGVYLIMLMGLLEGFFVPHYIFHLTPHEFDQKVQNVNFAFELMEEVGLQRPKARPEDVVNMDLKSTLRVLYSLFLRYKTIQ